MSLIGMQQRHVSALEPIYKRARERGYFAGITMIDRRKENYRHIDEMVNAGYSRHEAAASSLQCNDIAALNVDFERDFGGVGNDPARV